MLHQINYSIETPPDSSSMSAFSPSVSTPSVCSLHPGQRQLAWLATAFCPIAAARAVCFSFLAGSGCLHTRHSFISGRNNGHSWDRRNNHLRQLAGWPADTAGICAWTSLVPAWHSSLVPALAIGPLAFGRYFFSAHSIVAGFFSKFPLSFDSLVFLVAFLNSVGSQTSIIMILICPGSSLCFFVSFVVNL